MISADVRRAAWHAARAAVVSRELPGPIPTADTSTLRPGLPGQYVSTLPYLLADAATPPPQVAGVLASRLASLPWVAGVTSADGHLTVTVTDEALAIVAVRTVTAPDCARSDILHGLVVPAPPSPDLSAATDWRQARAEVVAEATARLASAAGAKIIYSERLAPGPSLESPASAAHPQPPQPGPIPVTAGTAPPEPGPPASPSVGATRPGGMPPERFRGSAGDLDPEGMATEEPELARRPGEGLAGRPGEGTVAVAVRFAGGDAVRYALVRRVRGWAGHGDAEVPVRYHLDNPVYAVRYAHAHAASTLRQAADLGLGAGSAAGFAPCRLTHPAERALLAALSWLPERVAWAARSQRPGEFARYLEEIAETYRDCREACPALPFGGQSAPRDEPGIRARLWLVTATASVLAAGLRLLGVSAPERL